MPVRFYNTEVTEQLVELLTSIHVCPCHNFCVYCSFQNKRQNLHFTPMSVRGTTCTCYFYLLEVAILIYLNK